MKNNSRIIILMIILTVIAIGLTCFLISFIRGGQGFNFVWDFSSSDEITGDPIMVEEYGLGEIQNIKVNYDCGNIYFEESNSNSIKLELYGDEEKDKYEVNTNDGVLEVNYKVNEKAKFFSISNVKRKIVVKVPRNFENKISIVNDAGNTKICDLESATLDIKSDAGDIKVGNIHNVSITCDAGNINIGEILNKCDIKNDAGNIEIEMVSLKENSKINCDFGNVKINNAHDVYVDAKCDFGNCKIENDNKDSEVTLKIYCDCGNITVK